MNKKLSLKNSKLVPSLLAGSLAISVTMLAGCNLSTSSSSNCNPGTLSSLDNAKAGSKQYLKKALVTTTENIIVPSYQEFDTKAKSLQTSVNTFCSVRTESNLQQAQNDWKALSEQWNKVALYNLSAPLSPVNNDEFTPLINRIDRSIFLKGANETASTQTAINDLMASSSTLNDSYFENLRTKDLDLVGLLALEILLFEDLTGAHSTNSTDVVNSYTDRKCDYLLGSAGDFQRTTQTIVAGWNDSFNGGDAFKDSFAWCELDNGAEPIAELIVSVQTYLNFYKDKKILGGTTLGSSIADNFYGDMTATLDELELLLEGKNDSDVSFFDQMQARGATQDIDTIKENLAEARAAVTAENLANLDLAIGKLDGNIKREFADGLGVVLGVNFADGD